MELVEGPTLADRLEKGALPLNETLAIARQMADALEAAHEKGVVHRDLKPANVKVREDGMVKVLDFELATAMLAGAHVPGHGADSPTPTLGATQAGLILGTAAYMAPEQAEGKPVDRRADIIRCAVGDADGQASVPRGHGAADAGGCAAQGSGFHAGTGRDARAGPGAAEAVFGSRCEESVAVDW
jgi:serine/threonine protein kinase